MSMQFIEEAYIGQQMVYSIKKKQMPDFRPGEYIIYQNGERFEIGKIKRVTDDGAFVYYNEGDTAAKTPFDCMHKLVNASTIKADSLGGEAPETTNEERIRSLSTERLARYIYDLGNGREYCYGHCAFQDNEEACSVAQDRQGGCIDGVIRWLKSTSVRKDGFK